MSQTTIRVRQLNMTSIMEAVYPIGSIYFNASSSTNPATLLGFGTWSAFATGRVIMGYSAGDTSFDSVEETGGAETHTLTEAEMPSHTHVQNQHRHILRSSSNQTVGSYVGRGTTASATRSVNSATGVNNNAGSGNAHNNLQPYIVAYLWKRTA